jgi:Tfp pilus assembly protein PilF
LNAPISLRKGIGNAHEKVTTFSNEAQAYYDQGLSFLYSYDWIHAARSFNAAVRRDPELAMGYLGLSYVYSAFADNTHALEMAKKAEQLSDSVNLAERRRIEIRLHQVGAISQTGARMPSSVVAELDNALSKNGGNINLLLIRAIASEGYATAVGQRGDAKSIGYYQQVLALDPSNVAAHHFLIHSYEMTNDLQEAIKHGEIYQQLAPAVAHAHHMYGHDLRRTVHLREAIEQFKKARELEESDYRSEPQTLLYDWNYRHNLKLLASAYVQAGLVLEAERTFKALAALPSMTPGDDLYKAQYAFFLLRERREKDAMAAAALLRESHFIVGWLVSHVVSGSAQAQLGSIGAREELFAAQNDLANLTPEWAGPVATPIEILKAQVEFLSGQNEQGVARLKGLILRIRSLPGADAWSDLVFHLDFIATVALDKQEWDLLRFVVRELQSQAPFDRATHAWVRRIAEYDVNHAPVTGKVKKSLGQIPSL